MKKLYMLLAGIAFAGMVNAQHIVLVNSDLSDLKNVLTEQQPDFHATNIDVTLTGASGRLQGPRYNANERPSLILEEGEPAVVINPTDEEAPYNPTFYIRFGSNTTVTAEKVANHYLSILPSEGFVNGGKVTLTISVNGNPGENGVSIFKVNEAGVADELLGTIDISGLAIHTKETHSISLPSSINGSTRLAIARTSKTGAFGAGVTFFLWDIKIETGDIANSINNPTFNANVSKVEYYNISGVNMGGDWNLLPAGIYIVKTTYDNGAVTTEKISKTRR